MRTSKGVVAVLGGLLAIGFTSAVGQTVRSVPASYPTIQAALNAASPGDEVQVAAGTYTGPGNRDLDPMGKSIRILGLGGFASTVIDCQGSMGSPHRAFLISAGGPGLILEGFTIRNGYGTDGGAISILNAAPTLVDLRIEICAAQSAGGAILVDASSGPPLPTLRLTDCVLVQNFAVDAGGSLAIRGSAAVVSLTRCTLTLNQCATGFAAGGAVWVGIGAQVSFDDCMITNNTAIRTGGITGTSSASIVLNGCTLTGNVSQGPGAIGGDGVTYSITECLIDGNTGGEGGGIGLSSGATATVASCSVSNNTVTGGGSGGGVYLSFGASLFITNSSIVGNSAQRGGGIAATHAVQIEATNVIIATNTSVSDAGGIYATDGGVLPLTTVSLTDGSVSGNVTGNCGGGMRLEGPVVMESTGVAVDDNVAGTEGGGIAASFGTTVSITRGSLSRNTARIGGGLHAVLGATTILESVDIASNLATNGPGGGIFARSFVGSGPLLTVRRCRLRHNQSATDCGGALAVSDGGPARVEGSFLLGNSAVIGGGLCAEGTGTTVTLSSCTMSDNSATGSSSTIRSLDALVAAENSILRSSGGAHLSVLGSGSLTIDYSDVTGGHPGLGNFDLDPMFVSAGTDDYRLSSTSPCREMGSLVLLPGTLLVDFDGTPRVSGIGLDVGADEVPPFLPGSGEDLSLTAAIDGEARPAFATVAVPGEILTVSITSPGGMFVGATPILVANLFPSTSPPAGPFVLPYIHVSLGSLLLLADGSAPFPFLTQVIGPGGFHLNVLVPPGLIGQVLRVQGAALSSMAANTLFAASDAYEITFF